MGINNTSEKLTNTKAFQEGAKAFQEGRVIKPKGVCGVWVKKRISRRHYEDFYKYNSVYCLLGTEDKKRVIGFTIVGRRPDMIPNNPRYMDLELLDDKELMQVDDYRRANNIYPRPIEDVKRTSTEETRGN